MTKWRLTGTPSQKAIVEDAFSKIKFPFDKLGITWLPELGWRDLNSGFASQSEFDPGGHEAATVKARGHQGHYTPDFEGPPEPLNGLIDGRRFTMGVFYPGSGKIFIDYRLERYPAMAQATLSAEIAHAVDEFLPLTDKQRDDMIEAWGGKLGDTTWWEKSDYSTEYWTLAGEMFMASFTDTYSDIPFGDVSSFKINPRNMSGDRLLKIMGIQRTDYVAPTPPPPPPPPAPVIAPEAVIIPLPAAPPAPVADPPAPPAPVPHTHSYVTYGKSKVAHKPTHYPKKTTGKTITGAHLPTGLVACKQCKPH
jgi:hypothetical protein